MPTMTTKTLNRDSAGKYQRYAFPGGYPIVYLDSENCTICPDCADDSDEDIFPIVASTINWEYEGEPATCDDCGKELEYAYGKTGE